MFHSEKTILFNLMKFIKLFIILNYLRCYLILINIGIEEIKLSCHGAKLKVILEAGLYPTPQDLYNACILAMEAGADYIKTSTGKDAVASLYNAYVMCRAIYDFKEKTGVKVGFKAAGGIVSTQDALLYLTIVKGVLGEEWVNTTDFRIGASRLANNILSAVTKEEVKYF